MIVQLVAATGDREGQTITVSSEKFIIGRADDCHLMPRSELVSRYHCAILVGDEVVVRDLGSKNGVRLNDEKICAEQKLKNGDKLSIGPLEFYIHINKDHSPSDGTQKSASDQASTLLNQQDDHDEHVHSTLLLDHLKTLNQIGTQEKEQPKPNSSSILKKILS